MILSFNSVSKFPALIKNSILRASEIFSNYETYPSSLKISYMCEHTNRKKRLDRRSNESIVASILAANLDIATGYIGRFNPSTLNIHFFKHSDLAEKAGLSIKTVIRIMSSFVQCGYIKTKRAPSGYFKYKKVTEKFYTDCFGHTLSWVRGQISYATKVRSDLINDKLSKNVDKNLGNISIINSFFSSKKPTIKKKVSNVNKKDIDSIVNSHIETHKINTSTPKNCMDFIKNIFSSPPDSPK